MHDELGYKTSFGNLVDGFVRSLKFKLKDEDRRWYKEVYSMRLGDKKVGFSQMVVFRKKNNTYFEINYSSFFLPMASKTEGLQESFAFDSLSSSIANAQGEELEGEATLLEGGSLSHNVKYKWNRGSYSVTGVIAGKKIKTRIKTKKKFISSYFKLKKIKKMVRKGRLAQLDFPNYWPSKDPYVPAFEKFNFNPTHRDTLGRRIVKGRLFQYLP